MTTPSVADLVGVAEADVYKAGLLAGRLRRDGDDVEFRYTDDYLSDAALPAIAVSLPRRAEPVRATAGAVPPFFAGLLPEGARLQAVMTGARTSIDDHLTLLLVVGSDAIGDVQVLPSGVPPTDPAPLFDPEQAGTDDFADVFARATSTNPDQLERVALPGVQVKVSAAMLSTPVGTTSGPAILKLDPDGYPHLVENEHFFLGMARACGLPVPDHRLLPDRAGRLGLLVERFDRVTAAGAPPRRLAQEDACQVLGRYPAAKYRLTFQEAATGLAHAVEVAGGSRPLALRRILETAAFSYLIGNGDLHGKNLSIRQAPSGLWEATPAYDLLSTQPYSSWRDPMALPMYGRANRLSRRWWLDAAQRLGLAERALTRALDRLVDVTRAHLDRLDAIGFDDATTDRLRELISTRCDELTG
ncbi:HipA domain-containing protein [Modestobacter sp. VKM Ac-2983]|uniref:type II toxin-antitoxin system HipA family toxin n=1 Tax=Modestobacter sp. VKM Ac-2983 TaxID=3004137 RepID=UPI0022AB93ED|nr:HipA domain-containing protein [Modestobacter sp. VKM Ac-2983]MCZ2804867.1 HipA domain-containing protein [Modestobacter sp. VKM Ac-2983]